MSVSRFGDWGKMRRVLFGSSKRVDRAIDRAMLQEGHFLRRQVVQGIRKQAPGGQKLRKLAPTTLAVRRFRGFKGRKALIRSGAQGLVGSISVLQKRGFVFIGVLRTARTPGGQSLVDVARVQEFGSKPIVIRMTDRMRRFLFAAFSRSRLTASVGGPGGTGIIVTQVPPRPFLRPVFERWAKPSNIQPRMINRVKILLKGDFGPPSFTPGK